MAQEGSFYTPIAGSREHGFKARPVFYGMKLAGTLVGGRMRPALFDAPAANASAWAADMPDGGVRVVVINKDNRQKMRVSIASGHEAKAWRLQAPGLTATSGVTLAGAEIAPDQPWKPDHEEHLASHDGQVEIEVGRGSAAAVFL
jgi:hypothetical protein